MRPLDKEYLDKQETAQRYLHGQLSEQENEAFEVYLLDNPELVDTLKLDALFVKHMPKAYAAKRQTRKLNVIQGFFRRPLNASLATAATCLIVFTSTMKIWEPMPEADVNASANLIYVSSMRGNQDVADAIVSISPKQRSSILVLQDSFEENQIYIVDAFYQSQSKVLEKVQYLSNNDSELLLVLDASQKHIGVLNIEYYPQGQPTEKRYLSVQFVE